MKKTSPFAQPEDKDVFLQRDTEKQRKKEMKERQKKMKIWEKKTASTRMGYKRYRDEDIKPASTAEFEVNFSRTNREQIMEAKRIVKSRVQYQRP